MKAKWIILLAVICLIAGCICGKKWSDAVNAPIVQTDTILVFDTIVHEIPIDVHHYTQVIDTVYSTEYVEIPADVDTMAILTDYFRTFRYTRNWNDSIIEVELVDFVTQNKITNSNWLQYKLLQPQTVITNTTEYNTYSKYITLSLDTDFRLVSPSFGVNYVGKTFGGGIRYYPVQNVWGAGISYTLIKLK